MYEGKTLKELAEMHPFLFAIWQWQEPQTIRGLNRTSNAETREFLFAMADGMEEAQNLNQEGLKITCVRSLQEAIRELEGIA